MASETGADTSKAAEVTLTNVPVKCRFATYWFNSKYGNVGITALPGRSKSGSHTKTLVKQDFELLFQLPYLMYFYFALRQRSLRPSVILRVSTVFYDCSSSPNTSWFTSNCSGRLHNSQRHWKMLEGKQTLILVSRNGWRAATIMATYLINKTTWRWRGYGRGRDGRGHPAIQTVKQYNFLHDYYAY